MDKTQGLEVRVEKNNNPGFISTYLDGDADSVVSLELD